MDRLDALIATLGIAADITTTFIASLFFALAMLRWLKEDMQNAIFCVLVAIFFVQ